MRLSETCFLQGIALSSVGNVWISPKAGSFRGRLGSTPRWARPGRQSIGIDCSSTLRLPHRGNARQASAHPIHQASDSRSQLQGSHQITFVRHMEGDAGGLEV